mmetsp:Transcript_25239/g.45802  ORF Transcript_25239/g.45802 Transcript_25239/m.45802 type:complete len:94 (+) Transcript_25239:181-462(+)|eukprot:CAMPEP_0175040452 /NCGR_PEP_ID=MMETSP0052_2-20121109/1271_1 /TAXON_ID=51329 ORGANISM="Polytomella parva, Strain SAG 63-3" /NCGR_SAMPLE_ID=MMETSP0052_2 /ASSEMBLY_ACC=CAM_ASM_000194 /LENGTH=93 /DNA_ID=CAMNT_0016302665 /DNA_START=68 /DNA_END=349 /DNA_ORIENTATION=+
MTKFGTREDGAKTQQEVREELKSEEQCAFCKLIVEDLCKDQFKEFDICMEAVQKGERSESECMPLFDAFRECSQQKPSLAGVVKRFLVNAIQT